MIPKKLQQMLNQQDVDYEVVPHRMSYTAQRTAAAAHIPGKELAKTVLVELDGEMAMVVLPAPYRVNMKKLKEITGARNARLASESEMADRMEDCSLGAAPPFGSLYHMPVFVDEDLTHDERIAFNAGSHSELIRMKYHDWAKMVHPRSADLHRHFRRFWVL